MNNECAMDQRINSAYIQVNDSDKMHYLQIGSGDPILFLHGMPTSSYLWRRIMPDLSDLALCIAPDLIGMGKSDKPDIAYRVFDHINYIDAFIESMNLSAITLVMHGWGSIIGLEYARRHPDKIKAVAFYEAHIRPTLSWDMLSLPMQQFIEQLKSQQDYSNLILEDNVLINRLLPAEAIDPISEDAINHYLSPFKQQKDCKPLLQYIEDFPIGDGPQDVVDLIGGYSQWLIASDVAKLMLFAIPGFMTTMDTVCWARDNLTNLTLVELNNAMHLAQESMPEEFTDQLKAWYRSII